MSHRLEAFIARPDVLRRLAPQIPGLRLLDLPQGLALAPLPEPMRRIDDDDPGGPAGTLCLPAALADLARELSRTAPLGWIETDWFGGHGENRGVLFDQGRARDLGDVNPVLRALGVVRTAHDEWDSVGLGDWRSTDRAYERATPVP